MRSRSGRFREAGGLALLVSLIAVFALDAGCSRQTAPPLPEPAPALAPAASGVRYLSAFNHALDLSTRFRVPEITQRRFTHQELWAALDPIVGQGVLQVEELGSSLQGRSIRSLTFGSGPTTVLLWSQMHGDESTATMALVDMARFFSAPGNDPLRETIRSRLTVTMVPMLNPDGAEMFQRRNAVGVDVNRDARRLATPEGRILKGLQERLHPRFGFNLHDQNPHTQAGREGPRASISLLAPAFNEQRDYDATRSRARQVASVIATVLQQEIPGRVTRYNDAFNPRAFGDLMQLWGTSTVLIESGVLEGDPQKQKLRALNFAAILTALEAIATGSYAAADISAYEEMPPNRGFSNDLLIRGGRVVFGDGEPLRLDVALSYEDPIAGTGLTLRDVGDLEGVYALEIVEAEGLFLHPDPERVTAADRGGWLVVGAPIAFTLRRGPEPDSELVRRFGTPPLHSHIRSGR